MKNRMFGLGEPITQTALRRGDDPEVALKLVEALGCTAIREWIHITTVLEDPTTPKPEAVKLYTYVLDRLKDMDVEITGMSHAWFLAGVTDSQHRSGSMYHRDLTEGSLYMQTLEMMEQSWATMAALFPQVTQWEVGNEWNLDMFLHPIGWKGGEEGFTPDEQMDIAVDMMYFSAKGIRRGNPDAKVVSFAPAITQPDLGGHKADFVPSGYGIAKAFTDIYSRIRSGDFWSTNTDDYFDMLAWHPYLQTHITPREIQGEYPATTHYMPMEGMDSHWKFMNDFVYDIMVRNGDGHKKVLLSEMGFTDWGIPEVEEAQIRMTEELFELVKTMPYIKTIHFFRLYAPEAKDIGELFSVLAEIYFGLFIMKDGKLVPREKARVLQKIYGGTNALS